MNDIEFINLGNGKYSLINERAYNYFKENGEWFCASNEGSYFDAVDEGKFTQALESFIRKEKLKKLLDNP